jgi:hypothetical protein
MGASVASFLILLDAAEPGHVPGIASRVRTKSCPGGLESWLWHGFRDSL